MKNLKDTLVLLVNEAKKNNSIKIQATYYFSSDNKENGYSNNANNAHPEISKKFFDTIEKHYIDKENIKEPRLDKQGHESVLEIAYIYSDVTAEIFNNIDELIKDLEQINDKSFIEYFGLKNEYKTN